MEGAALSPEELQQRITKLRSVVAADKRLFDECRELPKYYDGEEVWKPVARLIMAHANLCRGEITRAKHNLVRYMRGDEPTAQKRIVLAWAKEMRVYVAGIYDSMAEQDQVYEFLQSLPRESQKDKVATELLEVGAGLIFLELEQIKKLTEMLERYTYAG